MGQPLPKVKGTVVTFDEDDFRVIKYRVAMRLLEIHDTLTPEQQGLYEEHARDYEAMGMGISSSDHWHIMARVKKGLGPHDRDTPGDNFYISKDHLRKCEIWNTLTPEERKAVDYNPDNVELP